MGEYYKKGETTPVGIAIWIYKKIKEKLPKREKEEKIIPIKIGRRERRAYYSENEFAPIDFAIGAHKMLRMALSELEKKRKERMLKEKLKI
jgi:bifunctional DNase/RNase